VKNKDPKHPQQQRWCSVLRAKHQGSIAEIRNGAVLERKYEG